VDKIKALPSQIIIMVDVLKGELQNAAKTDDIDTARRSLSLAEKLADKINELASDAAAEVEALG
jgi:hypothetical protein